MSFSPYLVGTWETRLGVVSTFQVINPTTEPLEVLAAFLDNAGNVVDCRDTELGPNQIWELATGELDSRSGYGVVKFLAHEGRERVKPGIVGFQRHILAVPRAGEIAFSEAPLSAVMPIGEIDYPQDELVWLNGLCP